MKSISSKKLIILILMIFAVPFTAFLLFYNFYTVNLLDSRIAASNLGRVEFYRSFLEEDLHDAENFMANLVANDRSYGRLRYRISELDAHLFTTSILEKYRDVLSTQRTAAALLIYNPNNNLYRKAYRNDIAGGNREAVETYLRRLIETDEELGLRGWFTQEVEGRHYLFRILGASGAFTICMVDLGQILTPGSPAEDNPEGFFFFSTPGGEVLTAVDAVKAEGIRLQQPGYGTEGEPPDYYISGGAKRYLIVQSFSAYAGINQVYAMRYHNLLGKIDPLSLSLLIASALFILLLIVCFWLLKRNFFTPLSALVHTIEHIRSGNMEAKMSPAGRIEEFRQVSEAFNAMMEQIKELKIVAYEEKLEGEQAKLQYLQIQIRPHFFLNCLKNLYGLAEAENYKRIQEMLLVLSDYMRSLLQEDAVLIPLETELRNVEVYILLQQMSLSVPIACTMDVEAGLKDVPLPPLSILTFVENAVKHAIVPQTTLKIHIKIRLLESGEGQQMLNITVLDNGPGFPDETLRLLNSGSEESGGGRLGSEHIGIANVRRRFNLLYGDESMFFFDRRSGSCVEIFVPYRPEERGTASITHKTRG